METRQGVLGRILNGRRFAVQCAAALLLGLALLGLRQTDGETLAPLREAASTALTEDADWENLSPVTFVGQLFPTVQEVFSPAEEAPVLRAPVQGEAATGTDGVAYLAAGDTVTASAAGRVFYAGGDRVYLLHENGYQTRYRGLVPTVKAGQRLEAGDPLGSIRPGAVLTFTLLQDGRTLDAAAYLADPA